ncbi:MAG TPA: hypothetical protein PLN69_06650 [bacterium]|nr:hypothetical protein [bacterium]
MSEIYTKKQVGMKTVLLGAGIASISSKEGTYYVDLRIYDEFSIQPKRTTIEADLEMIQKIIDSLPEEHRKSIRKTVIEDGNFLLIDPGSVLEIAMIQGTVSWSKLLHRTCVIAENVFNPYDENPSCAAFGYV